MAWTLIALTCVPTTLGIVFAYWDRNSHRDIFGVEVFYAFAIVVAGAVGLRLLFRGRGAERNLGWIFVIGALVSSVILATDYATFALTVHRPPQTHFETKAERLLYVSQLARNRSQVTESR